MTAVAEDLDLDRWVTFSRGGEDDRCDWRSCVPLEAVAVATWDRQCCDKCRNPEKLCAPHRDEVLEGLAEDGPEFVCDFCGSDVVLLRIEPIR
jgi:hypothetical protein